MEVTPRFTLGSHAQHAHSLKEHTRSIQQSTIAHTKHFNNKITSTPKHIANCSSNNSQTLSKTQHTKQTDPLTEQYTQYNDITSHSPQPRSKRQ